MEVINCPQCGKVFTKIKNPLCPACEKKEEAMFHRLKDFIDENPSCHLKELAETTQVSPKLILRFIREGRLEISRGMQGEIRCERCNKPITRGRYCDKCRLDIKQCVDELFPDRDSPQKSGGAKMHITGHKKMQRG
ncbi:MAG: hypothetical protein LBT44_02310 [Clostridiales bacterium]|jgi:predicted amidophosphoribosyltransferase|nr:hypothetical protein [Clostridiales bacterium]